MYTCCERVEYCSTLPYLLVVWCTIMHPKASQTVLFILLTELLTELQRYHQFNIVNVMKYISGGYFMIYSKYIMLEKCGVCGVWCVC